MRAGCVICGDQFVSSSAVLATPCGHTFHNDCLLQWLNRSKTCPQCRSHSTERNTIKLFFDTVSNDTVEVEDPNTLQFLLTNAKFQVKLKEQLTVTLQEDLTTQQRHNTALREEVRKYDTKHKASKALVADYKAQLRFLGSVNDESKRLKEERDRAVAKLRSMGKLESLLQGTEAEVMRTLEDYGGSASEDARNLATVCTVLKRQIGEAADTRRVYRDEVLSLKAELKMKRQEAVTAQHNTAQLQQRAAEVAGDVRRLEEENASLCGKVAALEQAIASPSGDVYEGALRRLLREDATPQLLKRRRHSQAPAGAPAQATARGATPEVMLRKALCVQKELESAGRADVSLDMFDDDTDDSCGARPRPTLQDPTHSRIPLQELTQAEAALKLRLSLEHSKDASLAAAVTRPPRHNIFTTATGAGPRAGVPGVGKQQLPSPSPKPPPQDCRGYDGLGGHHTVDIFPTGRLPRRPATRGRGVGRPVVKVLLNGKPSSSTIANFFKNPFDD